MKVKYYPRGPQSYGNITWHPPRPMRGGRLLQRHPCHANPRPLVIGRADQPESDDPLGRLRARGYYASCFPEGDGMSFDPPPGRTDAQIMGDFAECFGFEVSYG